jgi:hypothetical protein
MAGDGAADDMVSRPAQRGEGQHRIGVIPDAFSSATLARFRVHDRSERDLSTPWAKNSHELFISETEIAEQCREWTVERMPAAMVGTPGCTRTGGLQSHSPPSSRRDFPVASERNA